MPQHEGEADPLLKPRLVRLARDRRRLIDLGVRKDVLDQVEGRICERRCAENVGDKLTRETLSSVVDLSQPVVRDKAISGIDKLNRSALEKL